MNDRHSQQPVPSVPAGAPGSPPFRVLLPHRELLLRIGELAAAVRRDHGAEPPCLVAVIEGARTFARHLRALLPGAPPVHEIRASSYGDGTVSSGRVTIGSAAGEPAAAAAGAGNGAGASSAAAAIAGIPCRGRAVLLLEDIVDTGRTVAALRELFLAAGARSCGIATLLTKPSHRVVAVPLDYVGFEIPDEFVLGFGMDLAGRYRELPDVVVYDEAIERSFAAKG